MVRDVFVIVYVRPVLAVLLVRTSVYVYHREAPHVACVRSLESIIIDVRGVRAYFLYWSGVDAYNPIGKPPKYDSTV